MNKNPDNRKQSQRFLFIYFSSCNPFQGELAGKTLLIQTLPLEKPPLHHDCHFTVLVKYHLKYSLWFCCWSCCSQQQDFLWLWQEQDQALALCRCLSELQMDCSRVSSVTRQSSPCLVQSRQEAAQGISLTVFAEFLRSTKVLTWFNTKSIRQTSCSYV